MQGKPKIIPMVNDFLSAKPQAKNRSHCLTNKPDHSQTRTDPIGSDKLKHDSKDRDSGKSPAV